MQITQPPTKKVRVKPRTRNQKRLREEHFVESAGGVTLGEVVDFALARYRSFLPGGANPRFWMSPVSKQA